MSHLITTRESEGWRLALSDGAASLLLVPRLGLRLPRYHFHLGRVVHAAQELDLFSVQGTLLLCNDHTGHAELTELKVASGLSAAEQASALVQIVNAAQALIRERPADFGDWLVAELPGWRDERGASPFWQALGARFYAGDPHQELAKLGDAWCSHLAALLPRQTVYLSFLGEAAQAQVAQAHDKAMPLLAALKATGFQPPTHVRIDDGGPVLAWRVPAHAA